MMRVRRLYPSNRARQDILSELFCPAGQDSPLQGTVLSGVWTGQEIELPTLTSPSSALKAAPRCSVYQNTLGAFHGAPCCFATIPFGAFCGARILYTATDARRTPGIF